MASAQSGEAIETTLLAQPDEVGADRIPVEGAVIIVYEGVIVDRAIESIGAEIARGTCPMRPVSSRSRFPGPASTSVELDVESLPEGIELVRADKSAAPRRRPHRSTESGAVQPR
jgi:hypothetical protein